MEDAVANSGMPLQGGTYRALLIGNDDYKPDRGPWKPLKTAVAGARALDDLLRNQYGFTDVKLLVNASRRDILVALQDLARRVVVNDSVVMYYAGHGYLDVETQKGYWVPVDAKGTDQTTFLRNSTIRDELSIIASRAKHTLLISDSCFSGTLLRSGTRGISVDSGTNAYYHKVADKKSIQILTAGGVEYVDDDYSTSGHSPFTYFLLNELKSNERPLLTASELSNKVEKAVGNNVEQVPQSGVLQGVGDEMGEFVFINVDVVVKGVPKEKVKVKVNVIEDNQQPAAAFGTSLRLGASIAGTGWSGRNDNSDVDFKSSSNQFGLNLVFQKSRFYSSLGFSSGEYTFKDDAPEQVTQASQESFQDVKIAHTELDLDVGYYFWKYVSIFLKLKAVRNIWDNNDYDTAFSGLGVGVSGHWPIAEKWDIFGSYAVVPNVSVYGDGDRIGDVSVGQFELGGAYTIRNNHRLSLGLRASSQNYDFENDDKQEHQLVGLFLGYDYRFDF